MWFFFLYIFDGTSKSTFFSTIHSKWCMAAFESNSHFDADIIFLFDFPSSFLVLFPFWAFEATLSRIDAVLYQGHLLLTMIMVFYEWSSNSINSSADIRNEQKKIEIDYELLRWLLRHSINHMPSIYFDDFRLFSRPLCSTSVERI